MPVNPSESPEGGQQVEWSETFHTWVFRGRIYLRRYWWIFLLTISAGVGLQAYKEYNSPPQYVSFAEMSVPTRVVTNETSAGVTEFMVNFQNQIHVIQGQKNMENAAAKVGEAKPVFFNNPPPWPTITANPVTNTSFIGLSATGINADYTQLFLQGVMDAYMDYKDQDTQLAIQKANNGMMQGVLAYDVKIKDLTDKKDDFLKANNVIQIETEAQTQGKKAADLSDALATRNSTLNALMSANLTRYVNGENVGEIDRTFVDKGVVQVDPTYNILKAQLKQAEALLSQKVNVWKEAHPKMIALRQNIADIESKLKGLRTQTAHDIQDLIDQLKTEITLNVEDLKQAEEKAHMYSGLQGTFNDYMSQIDMARQARDHLIALVSSLDSVKDLGAQGLSISIPASPAQRIYVNAVQKIGSGALAGLIVGGALIFLLGVIDGRIISVEDFSQRFEDPVLGIIPMQKRIGGQVELLKNNDQRLMFAESCRNLRSSLLYQDKQGQRPRSIVITSSIPSEGKSTISANLSITLGFAASRTLLVDADLRRGQLHKRFGVSNETGLAEHIQDGVPLEKVIQKTQFENLDFISCGKYPAQPGELLMSDGFQETVRLLKQRYDFVVFDAPPVLATDDAASFATRNDAVIFVVRAGYTRLRQIRGSLENLHRRNVHIYGVVVNFIDHREPGYYSYKYYDYYSYRTPGRSV